jgi:hypothetical protein
MEGIRIHISTDDAGALSYATMRRPDKVLAEGANAAQRHLRPQKKPHFSGFLPSIPERAINKQSAGSPAMPEVE